VPATVDHLIQRSEWLTAYTPYQPEVSQGTLQMLFEFQTQVAALTGMEVANASMYDGSTATAEAVLMARRLTRKDRIILSGGLHPHYRDVVRTYLDNSPNLIALPPSPEGRATSSARSTTTPRPSSPRPQPDCLCRRCATSRKRAEEIHPRCCVCDDGRGVVVDLAEDVALPFRRRRQRDEVGELSR